MTRQEFIDKYANEVVRSVQGTGIFPSVKMAQAIIESADKSGVPGNGVTARLGNNFFGIKVSNGWTGKSIQLNTPNDVALGGPAVSSFRAYSSPSDSLVDHTHFLLANRNYSAAGVFNAKTPEDQAYALQKAGYAGKGNTQYAPMIIGIIKQYNLKELDKKKV